jgi:quinol monooxygenase YgiN
VELRQYTLHPGMRDTLIDLFDREFIESQEAAGMTIIGQFRDLDGPNRFVWLRGFRDMPSRAEALAAFYGGPVWKTHRDAANATMIDSDNVLLLRSARPKSGFPVRTGSRPPPGATEVPSDLVVATICYLDAPAGPDVLYAFESTLKPRLIATGASVPAYFITESSTNTFPALPVREGEETFVWFSHFRNRAAYERHLDTLQRTLHGQSEVPGALARHFNRPPEILRLSPTARSQLRG